MPTSLLPHLGPPGLPVASCAALWATDVLAGRTPPEEWPDRLPETLDAVTPELAARSPELLAAWRDLGEHQVIAALPSPGRPGLVPLGRALIEAGSSAAVGVLVAPSLGDGLVLLASEFGTSQDGGVLLDAVRVDCPPVPAARVEMHDRRSVQRTLTEALRAGTEHLESIAAPPVWTGAGAGGLAPSSSPELPAGVPGEMVDLLERAAVVAAATTAGLATTSASLASTTGRARSLNRLRDAALDALEGATMAAGRSLR